LQVNYNRKKDLEFIINSWSFFFRDYSFFTAPFFSINQRQSDEMAKKKYEKIEQITEKYENF